MKQALTNLLNAIAWMFNVVRCSCGKWFYSNPTWWGVRQMRCDECDIKFRKEINKAILQAKNEYIKDLTNVYYETTNQHPKRHN